VFVTWERSLKGGVHGEDTLDGWLGADHTHAKAAFDKSRWRAGGNRQSQQSLGSAWQAAGKLLRNAKHVDAVGHIHAIRTHLYRYTFVLLAQ